MTYRYDTAGKRIYIRQYVLKTTLSFLIPFSIAIATIYFVFQSYGYPSSIILTTATLFLLVILLGIFVQIPTQINNFKTFNLSITEDKVVLRWGKRVKRITKSKITRITKDANGNLFIHTKWKGQSRIESFIEQRDHLVEEFRKIGIVEYQRDSLYLIKFLPFLILIVQFIATRYLGYMAFIVIGSFYVISVVVGVIHQIRTIGITTATVIDILIKASIIVYLLIYALRMVQ